MQNIRNKKQNVSTARLLSREYNTMKHSIAEQSTAQHGIHYIVLCHERQKTLPSLNMVKKGNEI
jgi:hypothetical protein